MTSQLCLLALGLVVCLCSTAVTADLSVFGNCLKGAQCAGRPLERGFPVCCQNEAQSPSQVQTLFEFGSSVYLMCRCPVADSANRLPGTCLQGSQCNACAQASMYNGHLLCCPNCRAGLVLFNGNCQC